MPFRRLLRAEALENRLALTILTVNSLADGAVNLADTTVTLRDAIHAANTDSQVSPGGPTGNLVDEIRFQSGLTGTITLNQGQLGLRSDLTVTGPGANWLTVSGNNAGGRVFDVTDFSATVRTVAISGLTVTGGRAPTYSGGGIINRENLTIQGCTITGNSAATSGGGIMNFASSRLTLQNSTISGNSAGGDGGGIYNQGWLYLEYSNITDNVAATVVTSFSGGGIFIASSGGAVITRSTLTRNEASYGGGLRGGGHLVVSNSTISGNRARHSGGGIVASVGNSYLTHVTITNNRADSDATGGGSGGGLHRIHANVRLEYTIVADNVRGAGLMEDDVSGTVRPDSSFNLIGTGGSGGLTNGINGNQIGVANPLLGPLADHGGPTQTHALLAGSPAINASDSHFDPHLFDQRGTPYVRVFGCVMDIGAFEEQDASSDFGDAPDTGPGTGPGNYNTLSTENGPRHSIVAGLALGTDIDIEVAATPDSAAIGDDLDCSRDDEDGVTDPNELTIRVGTQPTVNVNVRNLTGGPATLYGWIDYNSDGVFDNATERASAAVPNDTIGHLTLTFPTTPAGSYANTFARFRLSTDEAAADPTGPASDGEVEDYAVVAVGPPPPPPLGFAATTHSFTSTAAVPIVDLGVVSSTIAVTGAGPYLHNLTVQTFVSHTFNADLDITLTSPAGTVVTLTTDNGGAGENAFNGTVWNDDVNPGGQVPYVGNAGLVTDRRYFNNALASTLVPEEPLSAFIGEDPNGLWRLTISDNAAANVGMLSSWTLEVTSLTAAPTSSTQVVANNIPKAIPAGPAVVTSAIMVSGADPYLTGVDVTTFITHTYNSDLDITLASPAGTVVTLTTDNGLGFDNTFNGTLWDDDANPLGQVPYVNNYGLATDHSYANGNTATPLAPEEALGAFLGEDPNGTWVLTISDDFGGDSGSLNSWSLTIAATAGSPVIDGDFNDDGLYDDLDIDALVVAIAAGSHPPAFDLTGDALVDLADRDAWLAEAGGVNLGPGRVYLLGDANLDGVVDGSDFGIWNANKFTSVAAWTRGDFNADGVVDGSDFGIWNANKFTSSDLLRWKVNRGLKGVFV